jgi:mono/diheme cytochrome c family protein
VLGRFPFLTIAILVLALLAAGCGGDGEDAPEQQPAATDKGRQQFVTTCVACHALSDAATSGGIGPDLDDRAPDQDRVLSAIRSGPGTMPENL